MTDNDSSLSGTEEISFGIIASAGQARSYALEALQKARKGAFDEAHELLAQSKEAALQAHHVQMNLLSQEANGDHVAVDVMLVHAQDHLMCALLAQELAGELVNLYETKQDR